MEQDEQKTRQIADLTLAVKFAETNSQTMDRVAQLANEDTQKFIDELKSTNA